MIPQSCVKDAVRVTVVRSVKMHLYSVFIVSRDTSHSGLAWSDGRTGGLDAVDSCKKRRSFLEEGLQCSGHHALFSDFKPRFLKRHYASTRKTLQSVLEGAYNDTPLLRETELMNSQRSDRQAARTEQLPLLSLVLLDIAPAEVSQGALPAVKKKVEYLSGL